MALAMSPEEEALPPERLPVDPVLAGGYARALAAALPGATALIVTAQEDVLAAAGPLVSEPGASSGPSAGRLADLLSPSLAGALRAQLRGALAGHEQYFEVHATDRLTRHDVRLMPIDLGTEQPSAVLAVVQDITGKHQLGRELQAERRRRQMTEEVVGIGHWEVALPAWSVTLSAGAMRLLGLVGPERRPLDEVLDRVEAGDRDRLLAALRASPLPDRSDCECNIVARDGTRRRVHLRSVRVLEDGMESLVGTVVDVAERPAVEQAQHESVALFRQGFEGSPIGLALTHPRTGEYLRVNDSLCRLLEREREELLGRCFEDFTYPADIALDARGRREMLSGRRSEFSFEKRYIRPDGTLVWTMLHVTPILSSSGDIRAFFSQIVDMTVAKEREAQLLRNAADAERLAMIRTAIAEDRMVLHAQPIIDLASGRTVQQELLIRLRDDDGRMLPPAEFLPLAERYGLIRDIDRWVTERAVDLASTGQPVEVNLSAASVGDPELLATVRDALERTGADPSLIVFEVTETALMADLARGRDFAEALREVGCRFALDDFGTGYGTFTYLKHIPVDLLKIDIDFVRDLAENDEDATLVEAIVSMAHTLGKKTTAEGVENARTHERLRELGVDYAQGYHLGRPAPLAPS